MSLLALTAIIFYFNLITFGNGPVMIPLLQQRLVDQAHVLTFDQLLYAFAIGRVTPGQANVYVTAIGYFLFGLPGALLATAAIQLPGYAMLPLVHLHERFRQVAHVRRFIRGLTATSVGLILAATVGIGRETLTTVSAVVVFGLTFIMGYVLKWNPILSIAIATAIGLALYYLTS